MKIIFTTNNLPISVAIRFLTASDFHHCGVIFDCCDHVVYEASFARGVHCRHISDYAKSDKYAIVDFPLQKEKDALEFAESQIGKPYDFAGVIGLMAQRHWEDPERWYCSEFVAAVANAGGTPIVRSGVAGVHPRDLWMMPLNITETNIGELNAGNEA